MPRYCRQLCHCRAYRSADRRAESGTSNSSVGCFHTGAHGMHMGAALDGKKRMGRTQQRDPESPPIGRTRPVASFRELRNATEAPVTIPLYD